MKIYNGKYIIRRYTFIRTDLYIYITELYITELFIIQGDQWECVESNGYIFPPRFR